MPQDKPKKKKKLAIVSDVKNRILRETGEAASERQRTGTTFGGSAQRDEKNFIFGPAVTAYRNYEHNRISARARKRAGLPKKTVSRRKTP